MKWFSPLLLSAIVFTVPNNGAAEENAREGLFDYLKFQVAGNIGMIALGAGRQYRDDTVELDIWYGYVPESVGGIDIHTAAIKGQYRLVQAGRNQFYFGGMVLHSLGRQYYVTRFEKYERNYYYWTGMHLMPYLGLRTERTGSVTGHPVGLYVELGALDIYTAQFVQNTDTMSVGDILNIALGVFYPF